MDEHIKDFFCQFSDKNPHGQFHKVIALHDAPDGEFELIARALPAASRGWLELAQLPTLDRIELTKDFWQTKMRDYPRFSHFLDKFFATIQDIGIYITQHRFDDPLCCHMVYSLPNESGFFRGMLPASEDDLITIQSYFSEWVLPADYLAFLQVHNGFAKTTDCTGITATTCLVKNYEHFQNFLNQQDPLFTSKGKPVDSKALIPFYESFGMPFYQCFWGEWHPEGEMGNVYYSGLTHSIIDPDNDVGTAEQMAFSTFSDWLIFYLEGIE